MKALILEKSGSINNLKIVENKKKPNPQNNEIRIKVHAVGLNPSDYQTAEYDGLQNNDGTRVLGIDVSGTVDAIGREVTNFNIGDRVYYLRNINNPNGGFAEYAITTADAVSHLPDSVPFDVAAASPGAGFTAYQAIMQKLRVKSGKTILIHGGAGGVGGNAVQLAKLAGLTVYSTCLPTDLGYVKKLGADRAIDFVNEDVYKIVHELTDGLGVDYVLNVLGTDSATKDIDILAFNGELVVTAGFPDFDKINFYEKGLSIHEIALGLALTSEDYRAKENLVQIGDQFANLLENQSLIPPKITLISLEEIPEFLNKMKNGKVTGKIVAKLYN